MDGGGDADGRPAADAGERTCLGTSTDVEVAVDAVQVSACAAWPSVNGFAGAAHIARSGSDLTIDFGDGVLFAGTLIDGAISLVYTHQHPWTDSCTWEATETLVGTIDTECQVDLAYDYVEAVAVSDGSCDSPCYASSDVELTIDADVD